MQNDQRSFELLLSFLLLIVMHLLCVRASSCSIFKCDTFAVVVLEMIFKIAKNHAVLGLEFFLQTGKLRKLGNEGIFTVYLGSNISY